MCEIEFKVYVKDKRKIYNVKEIDFDYKCVKFKEENKPTDTMRMFEDVELLEYTGLKDKNGKKIFEGDILCLCKFTKPFIIYWTGISWCAKDIYGKKKEYAFGSDLIWECEKCEVIGNIYDNLEEQDVKD